ncbi:hypothetical protein EV182_007358, partial [Spiromyces aspiralis]
NLIVTLIIIVIEVVVLLVAFIRNHDANQYLNNHWTKYYNQRPGMLRVIEETYGCCGYKAPLDRAIPKSSMKACLESDYLGYNVGCRDMLTEAYVHYRKVVLGWLLALILVQLLTIILGSVTIKQGSWFLSEDEGA